MSIKQFTKAMKYKLYVHSNKGSFDWKSNEMLMKQLKHEIKELEEALDHGNSEMIIAEAADIANYAYFIADKARRGVK